MKKKKYALIITFAVVVILVGATVCMICHFLSPGVHFLFGHIHLDISETGCIMSENGEFLGEATFTAQGISQNTEIVSDGKFTLSLTGFPAILEENTRGALAYKANDGVWIVTVSKPSFTTDPETGKPIVERAAKYEIYDR